MDEVRTALSQALGEMGSPHAHYHGQENTGGDAAGCSSTTDSTVNVLEAEPEWTQFLAPPRGAATNAPSEATPLVPGWECPSCTFIDAAGSTKCICDRLRQQT